MKLSKSSLGLLESSPKDFWFKYISTEFVPSTETDSMKFGSAVHCLLLEGETAFKEIYVGMERRSKAQKEEAAILEQQGATILTPGKLDNCYKILEDLNTLSINAESKEIMSSIKEAEKKLEFNYKGFEFVGYADGVISDTLCIDLKIKGKTADNRQINSALYSEHCFEQVFLYSLALFGGFKSEQFKFIMCFDCGEYYNFEVITAKQWMYDLGQTKIDNQLSILNEYVSKYGMSSDTPWKREINLEPEIWMMG